MQTLFPVPDEPADVDAWFDSYRYPPIAGGRWWLRANMLSSVDGSVAGADGRSGTLSTRSDRELFHHLRHLCDAVVVGAGTARAENYGPPNVDDTRAGVRVAAGQGPRPRLVVLSRSLALDPAARLFSGPDRVIVVTSRAADWADVERLGQVAEVIRVGEDAVDLTEMLGLLADQGLRRLLCEGGPTLLGDLVAGRLLDELCLTMAPVLTAGGARRIADGPAAEPAVGMSLSSVARSDDGTLFTRWRRA